MAPDDYLKKIVETKSEKQTAKKTMWFVSIHSPMPEQIEEAREMGYELVHVKSPVFESPEEDRWVAWLNLFRTIPVKPGDAIVVMGEPAWIAAIVRMHERDNVHVINSEGDVVPVWTLDLYTTFTRRKVEEKVMPDGTVKKTSVFKHGGFMRI